MKTIYKYPLEVTDVQKVILDEDAQILCVQIQNGKPYIWVLTDPEAAGFPRLIRTYGTGHPIDDDPESRQQLKYIGTYQLLELVFHVFEEIEL